MGRARGNNISQVIVASGDRNCYTRNSENGSSGGGEMLAIRKRDGSPCPIYMVPFIPMAESDSVQIAHDFEMFAMALGRDGAEA
jgi:hypothetical protein